MGNMFINVVSLSFIMGFNQAISILAAQAYGRKDYYMCGVYLNRGRLFSAFVFLISVVFFFFSEDILLSIEMDP